MKITPAECTSLCCSSCLSTPCPFTDPSQVCLGTRCIAHQALLSVLISSLIPSSDCFLQPVHLDSQWCVHSSFTHIARSKVHETGEWEMSGFRKRVLLPQFTDLLIDSRKSHMQEEARDTGTCRTRIASFRLIKLDYPIK